jgi:pilus assembly protein Flp/PilA
MDTLAIVSLVDLWSMIRLRRTAAELIRGMVARIQREAGQTMAEYAILVTVIAVVVLAAATLLGASISSIFSSLAGNI